MRMFARYVPACTQASDTIGYGNLGTVTLHVQHVNQPPVATDAALSAFAGVEIQLRGVCNDCTPS